MKMTEQEAYEILLERIRQVFGNELKTLSETQGEILNGLILDRVEAHKGDYSKVSLDELEGVREMLYTEFSLAAVENNFERVDREQSGIQKGGSGGSEGDVLQESQLGSDTVNAIQQLFGMNDAQLKNLGIDPSQIEAIKKATGLTK